MVAQKEKRVLVTGGAGFIGSALVIELLSDPSIIVFNLDKISYSSDHKNIDNYIFKNKVGNENYRLMKIDLINENLVNEAIKESKPNWIINLAAETHVDRSISSSRQFIDSNIVGTYNILEASRSYWESLSNQNKEDFRFLHVSTDEVFGSLDGEAKFTENSNYAPNSPYSASKASSDHLVSAWNKTYGLPTLITNCSNNYGPWQFPEKLIPLVILKAIEKEKIPLYGDGKNIRDWLFVEDHIKAILLVINKGKIGDKYCIGGYGEKTNLEIVKMICKRMNEISKDSYNHSELIDFVTDRPGHDRKYAINPAKITKELNWNPMMGLDQGIKYTVDWYVKNIDWCKEVERKSGYKGRRLGVL